MLSSSRGRDAAMVMAALPSGNVTSQRTPGNADYGTAVFDRIDYHGIRAYRDVVANPDAAENLGACSDHDIVADLGTQTGIETHIQFLRAQRDALKNGDVAADVPGSDDRARGVREENSWSDFAAGCDFQAEQHQIEIAEQLRQCGNPGQQGRTAGAAERNGQKPRMQQTTEQLPEAGPMDRRLFVQTIVGYMLPGRILPGQILPGFVLRRDAALEFPLALEIARQKLF